MLIKESGAVEGLNKSAALIGSAVMTGESLENTHDVNVSYKEPENVVSESRVMNSDSKKIVKKETREVEYRSAEIRATDNDEGTFEGYAIVWNSLDSYNSMFRRGSAKKTLSERSGRIKVMWNHQELIGRVLSANEDDHGLFVRCKLTMELQRAKEVRALMQDGAVNTMSFGFDSVKEHMESGARIIDEIRLWEVSPVIFAANERTSIASVRSTDMMGVLSENMEGVTGTTLRDELAVKLNEIMYLSPDVALVDEAIADFHARYVSWSAKAISSGESVAPQNELAEISASAFGTRDTATIAAKWPVTQDEARCLLMGKTLGLEPRSRLALVSPELATTHAKARAAEVENLFQEIRAGGLTAAERTRMLALLGAQPQHTAPSTTAVVSEIERYVNQLIKGATK